MTYRKIKIKTYTVIKNKVKIICKLHDMNTVNQNDCAIESG